MFAVLPLLLVLVLPAVVLGILYVLRRKSSDISAVVAFTRIVAWVGVVLIGGSALVGTAAAIVNGESTLQVPVEPYWPEFPAVSDVTPDHGDAVRSEITTVTVTAANLGAATRGLLAAGSLVSGLAVIAVLAAVIALCSKLLAGKPFSNSLLRSGRLAACALALGTLIGQTLTGIGTYRAGEETLRVDGYFMTGDQVFSGPSPWPVPAFSINYEFAPLFMALAILVVVELVNAGMVMVRQNEQLRAETDGLVWSVELRNVHCRLTELLAERKMTVVQLGELVDVSVVNLSVLKNDRAKAIRFSTLVAICQALECEIGELLVLR